MAAFIGLFRRDLRLALRQGGDAGLVLGFFVLAVVLFPLGVGPEPAVLQRIGAGIVWVAALLAALLSLDRLFEADYQDGGWISLLCRACRSNSRCSPNAPRIGWQPAFRWR